MLLACAIGLLAFNRLSAAQDAQAPSMASSSELDVPQDLKAAVDARKTELSKFKLGVGRFLDLRPIKEDDASAGMAGSGYDYFDEVLAGLRASGLFQPAQLGLCNDEGSAAWDLVVGAQRLGGERRTLVLGWTGKDNASSKEELPLPMEWDRQASVWPAGKRRSAVMAQAGQLIAYKAAARFLGLAR